MLKDDQVYHSLSYKRKGNSCSYIVQFREGVNDDFWTCTVLFVCKEHKF